MKSSLPHPDQIWSHGTNSLAELSQAMQDSSITAIEADIVMGRDISSSVDVDWVVPIMSHPPIQESDLSAASFLEQTTKNGMTKHLKLDFKEFDAVEPTLDTFNNLNVNRRDGKCTVFLNADVLEGPGKASSDVTVPADEFIHKCLELVPSDSANVQYAFSLGFKVEVHSPFGHTNDHLQEMAAVVKRHDLTQRCAGMNVL